MADHKKSYGEENDLNLKLVVALSRVSLQEQRRTMRLLSDHGLTLPQFGVLEALYHKGDLRICEIIEKTLSTSGNMTVIIRNLELDGYVERIPDPDDKRAHRIHLTEAGSGIIEMVFPKHLDELAEWTSVFEGEEKLMLLSLLKKWGRRE